MPRTRRGAVALLRVIFRRHPRMPSVSPADSSCQDATKSCHHHLIVYWGSIFSALGSFRRPQRHLNEYGTFGHLICSRCGNASAAAAMRSLGLYNFGYQKNCGGHEEARYRPLYLGWVVPVTPGFCRRKDLTRLSPAYPRNQEYGCSRKAWRSQCS
ncbi:uncharacterized protein BCR38DRAFT_6426 [Pseudomassariella vexata]|uniref:Uncharacterized protein n=1 Tax=Pseudomassariella vexata TaxID=1141098 RepID=A0A1Y2EJ27_9PEZI|nr:uncharacterized protein BCR38DRAFT_6426 [Pseudomassariella vexata]ORY71246.1 hypothetical protein BCR38DRAFT_6426 [Pseudomassariella vexata]